MVSVLDFYSVNTSSDTAEVYFYFTIISKPPSFEAQSFALMQFWLKLHYFSPSKPAKLAGWPGFLFHALINYFIG